MVVTINHLPIMAISMAATGELGQNTIITTETTINTTRKQDKRPIGHHIDKKDLGHGSLVLATLSWKVSHHIKQEKDPTKTQLKIPVGQGTFIYKTTV